MDGTTDAGNAEDELIVVMGFKKDNTVHEVGSFARYSVFYSIVLISMKIRLDLAFFQFFETEQTFQFTVIPTEVFLEYSMYTLNRLTIIQHIQQMYCITTRTFPNRRKTFLLPICF